MTDTHTQTESRDAQRSRRNKQSKAELSNVDITHTINVVTDPIDHKGPRGWLISLLFAVIGIILIVAIFTLPAREAQAGAAIGLMLLLMFMKVPVAIALSVPGIIGIFALAGPRALKSVATSIPYDSVASWSLSVLPMFILMGLLLWSSGLTGKLYIAARHWLGFLPGGLAVGTNTAGTGLAAVSGSTIGTTYALARVGIPEMLRAGYDKKVAIGSVVVAGLPGQLIPPSTFLVIVAGLLSVPVGPQLIAGLVPGIVVSVLFSLTFIGMGIIKPKWVGRKQKGSDGPRINEGVTWGDRFRSALWLLPIFIIVFIVFGGMFSGLFTATEAGAVGALCALIVAILMQLRNNPIAQVVKGLVASVSSVGAIFLMLIGAHILGQLLAISGLGSLFSSFVVDLGLNRVSFLLVVMVIYIVLGMFMDPLAILLMTLPIFLPMLDALDVNLLWFGVFAVFMGELAILTPPVGVLSFVIHSIVQDPAVNLGTNITLGDVFKSVGLVFPMTIVFSVILIMLPELATWLPSLMSTQ